MSTANNSQIVDSEDSSRSQLVELDLCQLYVRQDEVQRLTFEERLVLEDEDGLHLDEVTIAVEADEGGSLLVYQYSQDESRLLRVQSLVNRSLDTDTELRRIKRSDLTRTLRVSHADDSYRVFVLSVTGREGWRYKVDYDKLNTGLIILEGSNIVLLRKLAVDRLFGQFRGQTINHEGELCECTYSVEEDEEGDGGNVIVRRVVTSSTDQETMTTLLSRGGYIRSHRWSSSDWHLVSGELTTWTDSDVSSGKEEPTSSELIVDADIDAYFQKKEELIQLMKMYFVEQPDVQDMIADFLKNLLFEKPKDVVDFADTFFSEFMGIDWTSKGSDDSLSLDNNYKSVSVNKSYGTGDFDIEQCRALDEEKKRSRSLRSFIKADILNAIINQIQCD